VDDRSEAPRRKSMRMMSGWRRSSRGNLYKEFSRRWRAVVIRPSLSRNTEEYSYLIADDKHSLTSFSERRYGTEREAWEALIMELEMRESSGMIRL
jgi:hypothetical protein